MYRKPDIRILKIMAASGGQRTDRQTESTILYYTDDMYAYVVQYIMIP